MYYIINIMHNADSTSYTMHDTNTGSNLILEIDKIRKYNINVENATINGEELRMKDGWEDIKHLNEFGMEVGGKDFIIIGKCSNGKYKCIEWSENIKYMTQTEIESYSIVNIGKLDEIKDLRSNKEIINSVDKQYKTFILKSKLLGGTMDFEYIIENNNVILSRYKGVSDKPVIPNFVTSIGANAFSYSDIVSIALNEGIRFIGDYAFKDTQLSKLIIPNTVEYMEMSAFYGCKALFSEKSENITKNVVIQGKNTIIRDIN